MNLTNKKGVDISSNNGDISMETIKNAGYDFVMIRCGFGEDIESQDDNRWEQNVRKAEAAGLPWGAYFYSYACSEESARSELRHALRLLKGKRPTMPVAFDMEDADGYKADHGGWNYHNVDRACRIFSRRYQGRRLLSHALHRLRGDRELYLAGGRGQLRHLVCALGAFLRLQGQKPLYVAVRRRDQSDREQFYPRRGRDRQRPLLPRLPDHHQERRL